MRMLGVLILLFSSLPSLASSPVPIQQPRGAMIGQQNGKPANPVAVPRCRVFENPVSPDGTVGDPSKLILEETLPATQWLVIAWALPEPYASIHLNAFYGQVSYMETAGDWFSFFQGNISQDGKILNWEDTSFQLSSEKPGDLVLVRGYYNFSPSVFLTFQCSLTFQSG